MFSFVTAFQTGLTVGEVAGLIAGSISVLHVVIPLLFAFVLVNVIRDRDFDAPTWSAISSILQGSWWPLLLQSDGSVGNFTGKTVRWRVFLLSSCVTSSTICLVIAGYLTTKPLVEVIVPSSKYHTAEFGYAADLSYYGQTTMVHESINRRCGWNVWMDCPSSIYNDPTIRNQYPNHTVINSTIPSITSDTFSSGTKSGTVVGPLDISYRAYTMEKSPVVDNDEPMPIGRMLNLPSLIMDKSYHAIEGLIVDTIDGGVGLRNHTVPLGMEIGAKWTEDILWIVPDTKCTKTNLTLHFSVTSNYSIKYSGDKGYLQDDGGFYNIPAYAPRPRWDTEEWRNTNGTPDLQQRADILAWWNNQFVAWTLDLHSSTPGAQYFDQVDNYAHMNEPGAVKITGFDGQFLDDISYSKQPNMKDLFEEYAFRCAGYYDWDPVIDDKAFVHCGYLYTLPSPQNGDSQSLRPDPGSPWKQDLYTCASGVYATIKEVTFSSNESATLAGLQVLDVKEKNYTNGTLPLWGIEKADAQKYAIWDIYKFWGLIDESYMNASNVDAYRTQRLYLPSAVHRTTLGKSMYDSFAAGGIFTAAWQSVYGYAASDTTASTNAIPNYSGMLDHGLTIRWRELSQNDNGVEKILNLIWTDLVAFTTAGTRMVFDGGNTSTAAATASSTTPSYKHENALGTRQIRRWIRVVEYSDLRYAIPAFAAATFFVLPLLISFAMVCCLPRPWRTLNHYMNQTTMGRTSTQLMYRNGPKYVSPTARTTEWAAKSRHVILEVPRIDDDRFHYSTRYAWRKASQSTMASGNASMSESSSLVDYQIQTQYQPYGQVQPQPHGQSQHQPYGQTPHQQYEQTQYQPYGQMPYTQVQSPVMIDSPVTSRRRGFMSQYTAVASHDTP